MPAELIALAREAREAARLLTTPVEALAVRLGGAPAGGLLDAALGAAFVLAAEGLLVSLEVTRGRADRVAALGLHAECDADRLAARLEAAGLVLARPRLDPDLLRRAATLADPPPGAALALLGAVADPLGADRLVLEGPAGDLADRGPIARPQLADALGLSGLVIVPSTPRSQRPALLGGDDRQQAAALRSVLAGEPGPRGDHVAARVAAGLVVAGAVQSIEAGLRRAHELLRTGAALENLRAAATV
jgi:anthranilate phosphoribosyltransferase